MNEKPESTRLLKLLSGAGLGLLSVTGAQAGTVMDDQGCAVNFESFSDGNGSRVGAAANDQCAELMASDRAPLSRFESFSAISGSRAGLEDKNDDCRSEE